MRVERTHNLGQAEARRRLDSFVDGLLARPLPSGVTIQEPNRSWSGNTLNFSFRAKKGWIGTTLAGTVLVGENSVVLESELPGLVTTFVPEEDIRAAINRQFDTLLQA